MCSALSFSEASSRSASPSPGLVVPAIGFREARVPSSLTSVSGEEPTSEIPSSSRRKWYGRRVDAPQRAVERERGDARSAAPPAARGRSGRRRRRGCAPSRAAPPPRRPRARGSAASGRGGHGREGGRRPGGEPLRDLGRVAGEHLGDAGGVVEADERVGDDEAALGQAGPGLRERHGRLELGDVVVAEVAHDRAARPRPPARPPRRSRGAPRRRRGCAAPAGPSPRTRAGSRRASPARSRR